MKYINFLGTVGITAMLVVLMMFAGCKKEEATISGIKISSAAETVKVGSSVKLSYTYEPSDAKPESAVWSSSDQIVASVDQNGVVTGLYEGTATITVKVNDKYTATCTVTVASNMTGITLSAHTLNLKVDSTKVLTVKVEPEGAHILHQEWSVSKDDVVVLGPEGYITGYKEGTATVTVKINDQFTDTCRVTVEKPVLLPGKFSVSTTKQVQFTKGNLYWDGSTFKFESGQTVYPTEWSTSHVGHFYWSKTSSAAYAENYSDSEKTTTDTFFCGEANALTIDGQSGLYALSSAEWTYLLSSTSSGGRGDGDSKFKCPVTVNGVASCLVIAPDGYTGTIASSYDADEWSTAESAGLVCLPAAGDRNGSSLMHSGSYGYYWSASPYGVNKDLAYRLYINDSNVNPSSSYSRGDGFSVRLVY